MKIKEALELVQKIREVSGDPECAHGYEDELRYQVLKAIVNGTAEDVVALAKIALSTEEIDFTRWYA